MHCSHWDSFHKKVTCWRADGTKSYSELHEYPTDGLVAGVFVTDGLNSLCVLHVTRDIGNDLTYPHVTMSREWWRMKVQYIVAPNIKIGDSY
jgi:hypothetical protein